MIEKKEEKIAEMGRTEKFSDEIDSKYPGYKNKPDSEGEENNEDAV